MPRLILSLASLVVGIAATTGAFLLFGGADSDAEVSRCINDRPEARLSFGTGTDTFGLCYPPTWTVEHDVDFDNQGNASFTDSIASLSSMRTSAEQLAGLKPQYAQWVRAQLRIFPPPAEPGLTSPTCGPKVPMQRRGDLDFCHGTGEPFEAGEPISHSLVFIDANGYAMRVRVEMIFDLQFAPDIEQYEALRDIWPVIEAEVLEMADDFARRTDERP
jgi:hypothetical protein